MRNPVDIPVERDPDGFLVNPSDWNIDLAHQLASEWDSLKLTDEHFKVIDFMRSFFDEHQIIPDVRDVTKFMAEEMGIPKKEAKKVLFKLFPHGYMQQGCQVAGMRRPRAWSVG